MADDAASNGSGAEPTSANVSVNNDRPLAVATRHVPPFAMKADDGSWSGIAIDLWRQIAERRGTDDYRFTEMGLTEMLDAVADGRVDTAVAALTITSAREKQMDFSHPFHTSGLGIAVHQRPSGGLLTTLRRMFSVQFLDVAFGLLALLTAVGVLIWLAERRGNGQFPSDPVRGIGSGLWWSAVTMTTVGYGDKAPATPLGRFVGMVWMFAGIIMVSSFTAAIATALTVGQLDHSIQRVEDLYGARVATIADSTSAAFLDARKLRYQPVDSLPEALARLANNKVDAVVYDAPILRHLVEANHRDNLRVLPFVLQRQDYGIALPQGSPAREGVNEALLEIIRGDEWQPLLERYLGISN
ncbi:MAG: transporter substrate-binding domain-containing protein [Thiohalocapsa sp.]